MAGPHDKIIAQAAKATLGPIGFVRMGRSRTWIADHRWWACIVEFQPSSWSKGSYLNVAAHWLWSGQNHVSFDYGGRIAEHVQFISEVQFEPAASVLASRAAEEALLLKRTFAAVDAAADVLLKQERQTNGRTLGGWPAYHAGVASALMSRFDDAAEMFARVTSGFAPSNSLLALTSGRMNDLLSDPSSFRSEVLSLIERHREILKLPKLAEPPL